LFCGLHLNGYFPEVILLNVSMALHDYVSLSLVKHVTINIKRWPRDRCDCIKSSKLPKI